MSRHMVLNVWEERLNPLPIVTDNQGLEEHYGLVPAENIQVGEKLIHIIRNQANVKKEAGNAFRPAMHGCVVEALLPAYVRVRFENNKVKNVRAHLLYRKKA